MGPLLQQCFSFWWCTGIRGDNRNLSSLSHPRSAKSVAVFVERKDSLVGDHLAEQHLEDGKIFERSLTLKQWTKDSSRFVGIHWTIQERKPEEQRIEGRNLSDTSKERSRNWFRGHCMICGRSVPTKCEQCRVYLCTDFKDEINSTCMKMFHKPKNLEKSKSTAADDEDWRLRGWCADIRILKTKDLFKWDIYFSLIQK
jgi:hypothetical protein